MNTNAPIETTALKSQLDYLAPDGSEIRLLLTMKGGGLCHCTLPEGRTSSAVSHQHVDEIWYVLEGNGEVWRKSSNVECTVPVIPGTCLTIPPATAFQFRNTAAGPLRIIIATMPPWPGPGEAEPAGGIWRAA
jgi:mannose-6-phosphate isomerase-like protein (cupin superfamily)